MDNEFEDAEERYEDQEEVDYDAAYLYEMIETIKDELRDGSTLKERPDSFKTYFEKLFNRSIDDIDDIEELISSNNTYINIYQIIRDELVKALDNYFGITFDDIEKVYLGNIYSIYNVVYIGFINFLCNYALGKGIEKGLDGEKIIKLANENNEKNAIDIADSIVGEYISNEDEFNSDNIAKALNISDPGNEDYLYLFGESEGGIEDEIKIAELPNVIIDNNAFRLRVKYEYSQSGVKYLFETAFNKLITN
jgi:hypothetical protein